MENEVKEPAPKYNFISPNEYLEIERQTEERNEYYDGIVLAKPAANLVNCILDRNLIGSLHDFLSNKNCEVLPSRMRVSNPSRENYLYPYASIVCGIPELEDDKSDTLTNPSVIFEISSPGEQGVDNRGKFFFYMQIPALREYIMIDSEKRHIIASRKQPDGSWRFEKLNETAEIINIETINFPLSFTQLYEGTGL